MTRIVQILALVAVLYGQAILAATPSFEAADVHASPARLHPEIHGSFHGDRIVLRDATIADLISTSYKVDPADVVGGPAWIDFNRFDINAKAPAGTNEEAGMMMLQSLLADRFKLVVHVEKRPLPAFILTTARIGGMKKADASAEARGCQFQQQASPGAPTAPMLVKFACHNVTMESFAEFLHDVASPYLTRPVIDKTGLQGGWDFDLQWAYRKSDSGGVSIFEAVDKQLGLKLESKATPTSVVVIDSVNDKPTPNVADLDKILPPAPAAQFEVAVIRPAAPEEKNFNVEIKGNRVNVRFATLLTLIYKSFDVNPGSIQNKPKWIDDVHYDVMGEASVGTAAASSQIPGAGPSLEFDDVKEMLRSLLADRFKLVTHVGSMPSSVYALVADNPKMKKANDANHPSCIEGPLPGAKDPRLDNPLLSRLISCQNMTMAQFAVELHAMVGGYVPAPVIDSTGLTGAYDFTLSFSKKADLNKPTAAPSASMDASSPADLSPGGISLFDALQKQLGLKLEKRDMVSMPTLVIDHLEPTPSDN